MVEYSMVCPHSGTLYCYRQKYFRSKLCAVEGFPLSVRVYVCAKSFPLYPTLQPYGLCQVPLSTGLSKQEYAFLQGISPTQGSNPRLLRLLRWQVGYLFFTTSTSWEAIGCGGIQMAVSKCEATGCF